MCMCVRVCFLSALTPRALSALGGNLYMDCLAVYHHTSVIVTLQNNHRISYFMSARYLGLLDGRIWKESHFESPAQLNIP